MNEPRIKQSDEIVTEQNPEGNAIETTTAMVQVPRDIGDLMVRPDALQVLERQVRILHSLRRASIGMTFPEDWLLFRAEDARTGAVSQYGYLQDKGCQRIRDLWGIDTRNVGPIDEKGLPGLRVDAGDGSFSIVMIGDGFCHKTGQTVERIEGGRSSGDDAVAKLVQAEERAGRKISKAQLDLTVRKNARANLEGNIVRRLTGMSGVTIEELADCWKGSQKNVAQCILGRGYGQGQGPRPRGVQESAGGESNYVNDPPPPCPKCGGETIYIRGKGDLAKGGYAPYWKCNAKPKNCKDRGVKGANVDAAEWHQSLAELQPEPASSDALPREPEPGWGG